MAQAVFQAIVLAAGKSSRFCTSASKLSYPLCGQEMILYPVKLLARQEFPLIIVVGHQQETIIDIITHANLPNISFVEQQIVNGTGGALAATKNLWTAEHLIIMNGDMPLMHESFLEKLLLQHLVHNATITLATTAALHATGYGYVIQEYGKIKRIIESRHFTGDRSESSLLNAGIYVIKRSFLEHALATIPLHQPSGEYYITDLIEYASRHQEPIEQVTIPFEIVRGVNTLREFSQVEQSKRQEIIQYWMERGVHFIHPESTIIDFNVTIEPNTVIGAGVHLLQETHIGAHCRIDPYTIIRQSNIHDHVTILAHSVIHQAEIQAHAQVGPFAHVRNHARIGQQAIIGNFVEVTQSTIGPKSKAKHLTYIGNAHIGTQVNIGAGTITANYDGFNKHQTTIEDHAHIGSNTVLVAPVTVGKNALVGAGSVITHHVPPDALALARERQVNKEGYAQKLRTRYVAAVTTSTLQTDNL